MRPTKPTLLLLGCALAALPAFAASDMFKAMDRNHDGGITAAEHAASARAMFRAMDADRDGRVTAAEMTAAQFKLTGRKPQESAMSSEEKIKVVDRDGDGVLTAAEHAAGSKSMFAKMDRNHDRRLSRPEFGAGHAQLTAKK